MRARVKIENTHTESSGDYTNLEGQRGVAKGLFEDHEQNAWVVVKLGYMFEEDGGEIAVVPYEVVKFYGSGVIPA
jgi:hypothetical protein